MRELLGNLERVPYQKVRGLLFLDTCFLIDAAERGRLSELNGRRVAVTSFNVEELVHVSHRLHDKTREALRRFLKGHPALTLVDVPVHPGERETERTFVSSVDPRLLEKVPDASDAVLIAAAIATRSDVLTKDKHHLFTVVLENFLNEYGIRVWKEWKDAA